jgi:hypothetical protein
MVPAKIKGILAPTLTPIIVLGLQLDLFLLVYFDVRVIFSDGIESDLLQFNSGMQAIILLAQRQGSHACGVLG